MDPCFSGVQSLHTPSEYDSKNHYTRFYPDLLVSQLHGGSVNCSSTVLHWQEQHLCDLPCCGPSVSAGCKQRDISLTAAVLYLLEPVRPLTDQQTNHQQIIFVQTCPSAAHCALEGMWQTRFNGIRSTWSKLILGHRRSMHLFSYSNSVWYLIRSPLNPAKY